jgi:two-component system chemotaxis response regulator CheY
MRILVVEDDLSSQVLMEELLNPLGEILVVSNGKEAISAFKNSLSDNAPLDVIFLDIVMPGIDGYEVLAEIRSIEREARILFEERITIIMLTTLHSQESITRSVYEGCDWYIPKPIRKETLLDLLDKIEKADPQKSIFAEAKNILYKPT